MSPHQRVLATAALKFCPMRSGASTGRWPAMVVFFQARGWRPRRPAACISRQTRLAATRTPRTTSSAQTRRTPGWGVEVAVDLADHLGELGVGALTLTRPVDQPPVVALADHPELVTHERDRELLGIGPVRDRRVFHGCCFANQAATFFAKSRSILRTALSLRSRSSSARSVSDRSLSWTRPLSFTFFTHLPNVISWTPILLATSAIDRPESRCRLTAWSLYSWVKLRRVATRFPPLAISGSHNRVSTRSGTVHSES